MAQASTVTPSVLLSLKTDKGNSGYCGNRRRVSLHRMPSYGGQRRPLPCHAPTTVIMPPDSPPITPVAKPKKTVRFCEDADLEHIRLFLKSQMPRAVKSDPPAHALHHYRLKYTRWPDRTRMYRSLEAGAGVRMENLLLDMPGDSLSLVGRCRVENIAFEKRVVVRYTVNCWRTYHEVRAEYREPVASAATASWDRFIFRIPLQNECQTIQLALHYQAENKEFWDNNDGQNYQLDIVESHADLPSPIVSHTNINNSNLSASRDSVRRPAAAKPAVSPLGRRYDFGASLLEARKMPPISGLPSPPLSSPTSDDDDDDVDNHPYPNATPYYLCSPTIFSTQPAPSVSYCLPQRHYHHHHHHHPPLSSSASPPQPSYGGPDFQMGYQEFVSKYCFHSSPSIYSTSPRAVQS